MAAGPQHIPAASTVPFKRIIAASALTAPLADPTPAATKALASDAAANAVVNTDGFPVVRLVFGGTDTANQTINFQAIGWSRGTSTTKTEVWLPRVLAKGTAILGDAVYSATGTGLGTAASLFADTISESIGLSRVYSPADETRAVLEVPLLNSERLEVQTDLGTALAADVFAQFGEPGLDAVRNVGLVNAAEVEIDPSEAQAANTAYAAADKLTPIGGVKSATRHTAAELETFADDDWVPVGVTGVHELRTRDDDVNTHFGTIGEAASYTGSVHAQLRYLADKLALLGTAGGGGYVRQDSTATMALESGGNLAALVSAAAGNAVPTIDSYAHDVVELAASTAAQVLIAAPGANKQLWIYGLMLKADTAAGTLVLQDEDDTALSGAMAVSDEGQILCPISGNFAMPWLKLATNKALEGNTGACTLDGVITYAIVSV